MQPIGTLVGEANKWYSETIVFSVLQKFEIQIIAVVWIFRRVKNLILLNNFVILYQFYYLQQQILHNYLITRSLKQCALNHFVVLYIDKFHYTNK